MNKYKFKIEDKFYPCANHKYWEINPITGDVRDVRTGEIIKITKNENDYVRICHKFTQHRLLAETFIEHNYPEGTKLHVHHIDGNKQNNNLDNLMWLTIKEHFNLPEWKELQSRVQTGLHEGENNPMYGYKWSEEQNEKRSKTMINVWKDNTHKQNLIKALSKRGDEWRKKIALSRVNKILVNNGTKCKFIEKEELKKYIDNGWKRGRLKK